MRGGTDRRPASEAEGADVPAAAHIRGLPNVDGVHDDAALGPLSPELVLIDPELARVARSRLPDVPTHPLPLLRTIGPSEADRAEILEPPLDLRAAPSALRYLVAGIVIGLLAAALAVEAYLWLDSVRSETATVGPVPGTSERPGAAQQGRPTPMPVAPRTSSTRASPSPPSATNPATTDPPRMIGQPAATKPSAARATPSATAFAWPAVKGATAYRFSLFRGGRRVLERTTRETRLPLPTRWRYAGVPRTLAPGSYRWVVRPLRRVGSKLSAGAPIVDASYRAS